jgi:hypothetical protein
MIEKRVSYFIKVQKAKIWNGLFPQNAFDFIWNKTAGKPREAIRLASLCLETARTNCHHRVQQVDLDAALKSFSAERLEDIGSELGYRFPGFTSFLRFFNGFHKEFPIAKVKDAVDACILKSLDNPQSTVAWIRGYESDYLDIAKVLLENQILFFKKARSDPPTVFDDTEHDIYNANAYVAFHPMYAAGLGLIGGT